MSLHKVKQILFFWKKSILWKLTLINGLVIGVAVWLSGVSVKNFACYLVNNYSFTGQGKLFNYTLEWYLLRASVTSIVIAGLIYFLFIRNNFVPLRRLAASTRQMTAGHYPEPLQVNSEDEIGQLTGDFNQLVANLKQMDSIRKNMLSDISHELRTPLSNINGYLEALSNGVIEGNRELFRSLHEESLHLNGLVDQLHEMTVWESKRLTKTQWKKLRMDQLIEENIDRFELELNRKEIIVELQIEPQNVMGDEDGLKKVMYNLLKNAIQYDLGKKITVIGKTIDNEYRVSVINKGQPISTEDQDKIFERFYRTDPSRQRQLGGSGLGLAIVKEIVAGHYGQTGLDSNEDVHTFWFTIPKEQKN